MSQVLVIAEHLNGQLNNSTAKAVNCAAQIGDVHVAVFSDSPAAVAEQAAQIDGVSKVLSVENVANSNALAATLAPQIAALSDGYSHLLMPSTTFGKDVLPRVAALLDRPQISDIMEVIDAQTFKRPIYAGNVITTVKAPEGLVVGTVRTASFKAAGTGGSAAVDAATVSADLPSHTRFVELQAAASERPDLQSAERVVSGGRGVGSEENFKVIYSLADKLGAAAGASRAAVDAGFCPNDMQVGQTGKIIAPGLYIAAGISGAIQHITGIKDAGVIVAINKDPDAPIFEVADIGLVADLFEALPEIEKHL
ncbi:MAG: electron transfer flavoprotein subunit alpha/FixB family protein [Gammaproteobacteria bacterium]|nr:electron transfer flavoprotein subunit alpha/FixB family protein [Gammaproteobacteria bacterium]NNC96674.1 electron transfer flavoprotein subunit alpha/FixB family protein [Gammaproteobacteria bacterium]NNM13224.1 electron transfer flavoprotein subunit alpha/FixB family protein [Gammaproteobacteria bacterium]